MTKWQLVTAGVILALPLLVGIFDLIAYKLGGNAATISRLSLQTAWEFPPYQWALCFEFGLLCAHLFVQSPAARPLPAVASLILFVFGPVVVVFATLVAGLRTPDAIGAQASRDYPLAVVMLWLNLGCFIGAAFLPQSGE